MFDETHANPHWRKAIPMRNMFEVLHGEIKSQQTQKNSQLAIGCQKITLSTIMVDQNEGRIYVVCTE